MKLAIFGKPQSGKTTVFETLTRNFSDSENRSENRIGTVTVPDARVEFLSRMYQPQKTTFAQVEYFLPGKPGGKKDSSVWAPIRDSDALIHIVRNFQGYHDDPPTPKDDLIYFDQEMILADLIVVEKRLEALDTEKKRGKKFNQDEYAALLECKDLLEKERPIRSDPALSSHPNIKGFTFLSAKPILALFNNEEDDGNCPDIDGYLPEQDCMVIRGSLEHELARMTEEEAEAFMSEYEISESAKERVIKKSYALLGLISFFTVGDDEVKAWTIKTDLEAVEAADVIHSDIKKGFIRAEVVYYDDLVKAGTYQAARKEGTVRLEGKTYPVRDGDIINFRFNV